MAMIKDSSPIDLVEIVKYSNDNNLWLGPSFDAIDFIHAKQAAGVIVRNSHTGAVEIAQLPPSFSPI